MATLELYLIRHGVAAERGEEFPDDSKRPLTSEGIARLRKEAKALEGLGVSFDQILSSPLVRARQTADVFAEELKGKPPIANTDALTNVMNRRALIARLTPLLDEPCVAAGELVIAMIDIVTSSSTSVKPDCSSRRAERRRVIIRGC